MSSGLHEDRRLVLFVLMYLVRLLVLVGIVVFWLFDETWFNFIGGVDLLIYDTVLAVVFLVIMPILASILIGLLVVGIWKEKAGMLDWLVSFGLGGMRFVGVWVVVFVIYNFLFGGLSHPNYGY